MLRTMSQTGLGVVVNATGCFEVSNTCFGYPTAGVAFRSLSVAISGQEEGLRNEFANGEA